MKSGVINKIEKARRYESDKDGIRMQSTPSHN